MPRTDHSEEILLIREEADRLNTTYVIGLTPLDKEIRVHSYRAAADLLEIHDSTGLNLTEAPTICAFVEFVLETAIGAYGMKVVNNHA